MPHPLLQYVKSLLELHGSVVEDDGDTLQVVLSKDAARALEEADAKLKYEGDAPYGAFHFDRIRETQSNNSVYITYGSPALKKLTELMEGSGLVAAYVYEGMHLKKTHLDDQLRQTFQWIKMKPIWEGANERLHSYLLLYYKYKALSDDRIEGLVRVAVSEQTGAIPEQFAKRDEEYSFRAVTFSRRHENICSTRLPLATILDYSDAHAKLIARQELELFIKRMQERYERDSKRVHEYYTALKTQIAEYIEKRNFEKDARKKQEEKIHAIDRDLQHAQSDIHKKYSVDVVITPVAAVRIFVPVLVSSIAVLQGKNRSRIEMVWNPITKAYDPVSCASCAGAMYTIGTCPNWHWLCRVCYNTVCANCGKKRCPACVPSCERCGQGDVN